MCIGKRRAAAAGGAALIHPARHIQPRLLRAPSRCCVQTGRGRRARKDDREQGQWGHLCQKPGKDCHSQPLSPPEKVEGRQWQLPQYPQVCRTHLRCFLCSLPSFQVQRWHRSASLRLVLLPELQALVPPHPFPYGSPTPPPAGRDFRAPVLQGQPHTSLVGRWDICPHAGVGTPLRTHCPSQPRVVACPAVQLPSSQRGVLWVSDTCACFLEPHLMPDAGFLSLSTPTGLEGQSSPHLFCVFLNFSSSSFSVAQRTPTSVFVAAPIPLSAHLELVPQQTPCPLRGGAISLISVPTVHLSTMCSTDPHGHRGREAGTGNVA